MSKWIECKGCGTKLRFSDQSEAREWKKCDACGEKYKNEACPYCTIVVIDRDDLPSGILLLSNVRRHEWESALKKYHDASGSKWDKCMVLFGIDPAFETRAQYIEFEDRCACHNAKSSIPSNP